MNLEVRKLPMKKYNEKEICKYHTNSKEITRNALIEWEKKANVKTKQKREKNKRKCTKNRKNKNNKWEKMHDTKMEKNHKKKIYSQKSLGKTRQLEKAHKYGENKKAAKNKNKQK